jgi:hypothetical protein
MKLILYDDNNKVLDIRADINVIEVSDHKVVWETGNLNGIKANFIVLPDEVFVAEEVTSEIVSRDIKSNLVKVDLVKENEALKKANQELETRLGSAELAIITLMDRI